jgi:hypothetical protein
MDKTFFFVLGFVIAILVVLMFTRPVSIIPDIEELVEAEARCQTALNDCMVQLRAEEGVIKYEYIIERAKGEK